MKILLIAPIPPPLNGQSLTAKVFLEAIGMNHECETVNMVKEDHRDGTINLNRIIEVCKILMQTYRKQKRANSINLHLSESIAGNLKDLVIYMLCYRKLSNLYIYSHGCSIKSWVFDRNKVLFKLNKFFISRSAGIIVTGRSHIPMFEGMLSSEKIHIVPNFAEDYLFTKPEHIINKFKKSHPIKVLYLSNLIPGKGYEFLLDAFTSMDIELRKQFKLTFAGSFGSAGSDKERFMSIIKKYPEISYAGFVQGESKKQLLQDSHVLCFPSYLMEGQGICILEGYAAGCAVVTTGKSGISDVFTDKINGYKIEEKSSSSIREVLTYVAKNPESCRNFAMENFKLAFDKYRSANFSQSLERILEL